MNHHKLVGRKQASLYLEEGQEEDLGSYWLGSLTLISGKDKRVNCAKDRKVIKGSQCGFVAYQPHRLLQ